MVSHVARLGFCLLTTSYSPVDSSGRCVGTTVSSTLRLRITFVGRAQGWRWLRLMSRLPCLHLQFTSSRNHPSTNESSLAVTATTGAGVAAGGETTAPSRGRAPSWLAGCTSRQRAARQMVGNSVVYPHPIGGTRDAGDGSCCAGCQERCYRATTRRGGDVRRLASNGE